MPKLIIALALVTREELQLLGPQFSRAYPIDETPCFGALLAAIDDADRSLWRERDARAEVNDKQECPEVIVPTLMTRG